MNSFVLRKRKQDEPLDMSPSLNDGEEKWKRLTLPRERE